MNSERRGAKLGRGDRRVAVFLKGDRDLAVAHGDRGHIFCFAKFGRRCCEVSEDGELDGRARVGGVGCLNVCELVVVHFGAEGEVRKFLKCHLVGGEVRGARFSCVIVSHLGLTPLVG